MFYKSSEPEDELKRDTIIMRILVNDVAAENSGALTILESFYHEFCRDTSSEYVLCVSKPSFNSISNVQVLSFPWVKISWFHRLWFEVITTNRLIRKLKIDEVFSLQNIVTPFTRKPQTLYLQLSLPFDDIRFSLFDAPQFWIYQKIIGPMIIHSVKRAKSIIVQTEWMKAAVMKTANVSREKIVVQTPNLCIEIPGRFSTIAWQRYFFYPATPLVYKNHKTLFRAMQILKAGGISNFKVLLTIDRRKLPKDWAGYIEDIDENIIFLGNISHQEVMQLYCKSVLVFPSYIETYGLPLKEASLCRAPIIAADRPFSREVLSEYDTKCYFQSFDADSLAKCMRAYLDVATGEVET